MGRRLGKPRVTTSVTISPEFFELCRINNIGFSEATRVGIAILLAERGVKEYDNNLNIMRKMTLIKTKLEETSQELNKLKEKNAKQLSEG